MGVVDGERCNRVEVGKARDHVSELALLAAREALGVDSSLLLLIHYPNYKKKLTPALPQEYYQVTI